MWEEILREAEKRVVQLTARKLSWMARRKGLELTPWRARELLDEIAEEARGRGLAVVREGRRGKPRKLYIAPMGVNPYLEFLEEG